MSHPESMLAEMRASLAPGGRIALLEYRVEDGTGDRIKADHTMSVRQVLQEWQAAGFELVDLHDFLPTQHLFIFRAAADQSGGVVLEDYDLFEALDAGYVEAEAIGAGIGRVTIRIRRRLEEPILVTSPAAIHFASEGTAHDMIARRDGWIVLADDGWHDWSLRAVGRQAQRRAPGGSDSLTILAPATRPELAVLLRQIQVGTYQVADSPTLYPPRTMGVEQAAIWIVDADDDYRAIARRIDDGPVPEQYAVAFALVFCDLAGIDVTTRRVWQDRADIFDGLRDPGLSRWYQLRSAER
jgi:hypothetical protein